MTLSSVFLLAIALLLLFIVLFAAWILHILKSTRQSVPPTELLQDVVYDELAEQDDIVELHRQAFVYNDFDALQKLVNYFRGAVEYWVAHPESAPLLADGIKKLAELMEAGNAPRKAELEDFFYAGLMYEQGFECEPDLEKALSYFEKALDTQTCWSHDKEYNDMLHAQVEKKIRDINIFFFQRQLHNS